MKNLPSCNRDDCFAHKDGKCVLLTSNCFGERECPFFKTKEQAEAESKKYFKNIYINEED